MAPAPAPARAPRAGRALLAAAALLLGCPEESSGPDAAGPAPVQAPGGAPPADDAAATAFQGIELPPFEPLPVPPPELPPLQLTPLPTDLPPVSSPESEAEVERAPVAALEDLLRIPAATAPRADSDETEGTAAPSGAAQEAAAAEPGAVERLRERVRVERRSEPIGPKGPRQGTRSETDAGIRVPLDEAVSVEGGVRVDQRDEPGASAADRKSTPRVGVEVKF